MPGIGGGAIYAPGTQYNGMPIAPALYLAAQNGDLQTLQNLPQFKGIGWEGLLAQLGIMGGGALVSALSGAGTTAATTAGDIASGASGASATPSLASIAAGTVPELPSLPATVALPAGVSSLAAPAATFAAPAAAGSASLLSRLLPTLISSGTSLLGGTLGASAANNAAALQAAAANHAADLQAAAAQNSLDFQKQVLAQQQANAQPWLTAGSNALTTIANMVGSPGFQWTGGPFTAPTAEQAAATPGYQFQLQQGEQALEQWERANGTLLSGKAAKDINSYAQGIASENYSNVFNRALEGYNTNYGVFQNERAANLNPELSIAGLGQVSTGNLNANLSGAAGLNTNTQLTSAQNVGNLGQQAAQATAAGNIAGTNAINSALTSVGNNLTSALSPYGSVSAQQLMAALTASGYRPAGT